MKKEVFTVGLVAIIATGIIVLEAKRAIRDTPATDSSTGAKDRYAGISSKELLENINQGSRFILVDLRTYAEYSKGHIAGAINIPVADIEGHLRNLSKEKEIILYCKSGPWSRQAYRILKGNGFNNIKVLENGIVGWKWEVNGDVVASSQP